MHVEKSRFLGQRDVMNPRIFPEIGQAGIVDVDFKIKNKLDRSLGNCIIKPQGGIVPVEGRKVPIGIYN